MSNKLKPMDAAVLLQRLTERLAKTPAVVRRTNPKGALIEQLREPLQALRAEYRCTWPALVALLADCGFKIHLSTLKRYLGPNTAARAVFPTGAPAVNAPLPSAIAPEAMPPCAPKPGLSDAVTLVVTPAPAPVAEATPSEPPARLHLTSRFTPKPEIPYRELLRQAEARKQAQDTAAPASDETPGSSSPPPSTAGSSAS